MGLALVLALTGFSTCSIAGATGRASRALGNGTVGARSDQPGTLSRPDPAGDLDHWREERLALTGFDRDLGAIAAEADEQASAPLWPPERPWPRPRRPPRPPEKIAALVSRSPARAVVQDSTARPRPPGLNSSSSGQAGGLAPTGDRRMS